MFAKTSVPQTGTHVVLLGTSGGPVPFPGRSGICTAVVVDGYTYLVDLGHGAFDQLGATDLSPERIPAAFVTHLHSDHLADAFALPWLRFGGVNPLGLPLHVYGPGRAGWLPEGRVEDPPPLVNPGNPTPGISDFFASAIQAAAYDINLRTRDEGWPDIRQMLVPHDIEVLDGQEPFEVMKDERVRVSAVLVDHPPVTPSFGFRFDTAKGSVVISGDTTVSANLIRLAQGADVLVHEVIDLEVMALDPDLSPEQIAHLTESHTDVKRVGQVAAAAGVRQLVLSHLAPGTPNVPDASWKAKAQNGFDGPVHVGHDLDVITPGGAG
ncbi:MBL fold metallo-hydrolase [Kineosporia babensis]|uniref:MBL fold metallo-hydrolase n=1 Tax=Kineosporia babensis TaxID=499548 RepID=A0A9X1NL57_9ACTN|nr:MBL fold metallo-hydrolase [Kineosporia babensis]MCD5315156.1 MBL fold metallo-hydrolase [Kineosporia babensis]